MLINLMVKSRLMAPPPAHDGWLRAVTVAATDRPASTDTDTDRMDGIGGVHMNTIISSPQSPVPTLVLI